MQRFKVKILKNTDDMARFCVPGPFEIFTNRIVNDAEIHFLKRKNTAVSKPADAKLEYHLVGKNDGARAEIAHRVGERLSNDALPDSDRRAAEAIAAELACDAIERVRCELSNRRGAAGKN